MLFVVYIFNRKNRYEIKTNNYYGLAVNILKQFLKLRYQ